MLQMSTAYQDTYQLYAMHFLFAFISRVWDMGIVLLIAYFTDNSLFFIALVGFISTGLCFICMPPIGVWLDNTNRLVAIQTILLIKVVSISLTFLLCAYLSQPNVNTNTIYLFPLLCAVVNICFIAITQSIEKDWIVVLSSDDNTWLAQTNSIMSQIDLGCSSVAPALVGFLFAFSNVTYVSIALLATNLVSTLMLMIFMIKLYNSWPKLAKKDHCTDQVQLNFDSDEESTVQPLLFQCYVNIYLFIDSGCCGVMIAYSCLYLTVLNFGSIMTVYLKWKGVSDYWIGVSRGSAAITGFMGAFIFPYLNKKFGLHNTAQLAILQQCLLVAIAASSFLFTSSITSVTILIVAVLLSRSGLWLFDIAAKQISQECIDERHRGRVNGVWRSLISFLEMCGYFISMFSSDPNNFWILTTISAGMVVLAALIYTISNSYNSLFQQTTKYEQIL